MNDVYEELSRARAEATHWKANHDAQVERARFLVERGDLPLERVRAYQTMAAYHDALQRAGAAAGLLPGADTTKELVSQIWLLRELLWNALAYAEREGVRLPFHEIIKQTAALSTDKK